MQEHETITLNEESTEEQEISLQKFFTQVYDRVYFTAELRAQDDYAKSQNKALEDREQLLSVKKTRHRIIHFFGLPSGDSKNPIKILKSLAGWNDNYSTSRKVLQALFIFPINLLLTASKLALNIVKLATEFLPYILAKGSLRLFNICNDFLKTMTSFEDPKEKGIGGVVIIGLAKLAVSLGVLILGTLTAALHIAYFIGGATTSPAENFRAAYRAGYELAGGNPLEGVESQVEYNNKKFNNKTGKLVGSIFALVSALTTACVYAVLFPVLLTQAPAVLPAIANGISQFIGIFSAQAGASATAFFATTLPAALTSFGATISGVAEPLLVGIAAFAAIGAGVIITPTVVALDELGEIKEAQKADEGYLYDNGKGNENYYAKRMGIKNLQYVKLVREENSYKPLYKPVIGPVREFPKFPSLGGSQYNKLQ